MSRIGVQPVEVPSGVEVSIQTGTIIIKGSKGELSLDFAKDNVEIKQEESSLIVSRKDDTKESRALHGLTRSLLANMIEGVSKGFEKRLEIHGVGYRAAIAGSKLTLTLGFSHPVEMTAPEGITVAMDEQEKNQIIVSGIDKQKVGQFAAEIREWRKPEPYKGKGIRYVGEYVRRKAGKAAAKS